MMKIRSFLTVFLCGISAAPMVQARPVSYPGGWTVMTQNDADAYNTVVHYTFTPKLAVGYVFDYDRKAGNAMHGVQMNYLLQRWNNPDSQANIYLKSGVGIVDEHNGDWGGEGFTGLQADWENRRLMVSYENSAVLSNDKARREFMQQAGLGIAPYVAEAGALHTWAMFHVIHDPEDNHPFQAQPMLRFFKGDLLLETGYNMTKSKAVVNGIIRF